MTPELWVAVIVALVSAVPAMGALALGFVNRHAIHAVHLEINSRLSELITARSRAEHADGVVSGGMNANEIKLLISAALAETLATPPTTMIVPSLAEVVERNRETMDRVRALELGGAATRPQSVDSALSIDTNERVRDIQEDASAVAEALVVKTARDDATAQKTTADALAHHTANAHRLDALEANEARD